MGEVVVKDTVFLEARELKQPLYKPDKTNHGVLKTMSYCKCACCLWNESSLTVFHQVIQVCLPNQIVGRTRAVINLLQPRMTREEGKWQTKEGPCVLMEILAQ